MQLTCQKIKNVIWKVSKALVAWLVYPLSFLSIDIEIKMLNNWIVL